MVLKYVIRAVICRLEIIVCVCGMCLPSLKVMTLQSNFINLCLTGAFMYALYVLTCTKSGDIVQENVNNGLGVCITTFKLLKWWHFNTEKLCVFMCAWFWNVRVVTLYKKIAYKWCVCVHLVRTCKLSKWWHSDRNFIYFCV